MKKLFLSICALLPVFLNSCVKKETPVPRHESGDVTTSAVSMDPTYKYQVYFSLKENKVVGQNLKTVWDIGFKTSADGYHVVLNTSKSMFAMKTGKTDFAAVSFTDTTGFGENKKWDAFSGDMDSTSIGDWRSSKPIYIIDRGFNEAGAFLGYEKLQVLSVNSSAYTVRFAALNGSGDTTVTMAKDSAYNLAFLSFSTKQQLQVEPPKNTWDLQFSQYTFVFYDQVPAVPYLVTGCLLNRKNTTAALDTTGKFAQLSFSDVGNYTFSSNISTIGYDWKTYNGTSYTVNTKNTYIIRSAEGVYYKLHFIGFYSTTGQKGNPTWEYQQL